MQSVSYAGSSFGGFPVAACCYEFASALAFSCLRVRVVSELARVPLMSAFCALVKSYN